MKKFLPDLQITPKYKDMLSLPVGEIINTIIELDKMNNYNNQQFVVDIFSLNLKAFQTLEPNLKFSFHNNLPKLKATHNYLHMLEQHNKEVERRGLNIVQTLNTSELDYNLDKIFKDNVERQQASTLFNSGILTEDEKEHYFLTTRIIFQKLSDHNFTPAIFETAYINYISNKGHSTEEKAQILSLLNKCIKNKFILAEHFLATLKVGNFFEQFTEEDGIKDLERIGSQGFSYSYCFLGELYEKKNLYKSLYYYDKAYQLNDAYAAHMLGFLYLTELIHQQDITKVIPEGIEYLKFAAKKGEIEASYMLGTIYYEDYLNLGYKTENLEKSVEYLRNICKEKPESYILLGHIYLKLIFDPKYYDHPMNTKYLTMSDREYKEFLNKNLILFTPQAERNNITYENHPGISIHTQYCMYYLSQGIKADLLQCFYYLGYLYGKGVSGRIPINYEECLTILKKGGEQHEGCNQLYKYFSELKEKTTEESNNK